MKNKTNTIIVIILLIVLIASLCGNFYFMFKESAPNLTTIKVTGSNEEYDAKYADFDKQDKKIKLSIFNGALDVSSSPTEVKYLMLKMANDLTPEEKDDVIAKYINHIQYFATTYTNVAIMYEPILDALSSSIGFESRDAAFQISDKVLRNLLLEIWDADMILYISEDTTVPPSVIVDYEGLKETYRDFITETTSDYLDLKIGIISGNITNEDNSMNYDKLIEFMDNTYEFINTHPQFPIIADVQYMNIVAAKMFLDVYLLETDTQTYDEEAIARIENFVASHKGTPDGDIAQMVLDDVAENGMLTSEGYNEVMSAFAALSN